MPLEAMIIKAIELSRVASNEDDSFGFLLNIIESLERMIDVLREGLATREQRMNMAATLGELVTENLEFSESELGGILVKIADDFEVSVCRL